MLGDNGRKQAALKSEHSDLQLNDMFLTLALTVSSAAPAMLNVAALQQFLPLDT